MTVTPVVCEKFEVRVEVTTNQEVNFFDYDQIELQAVFRSPTLNEKTIDAFYYQDFISHEDGELTAVSEPHYRIRFSPEEAGIWDFKLILTDHAGTDQTGWQSFTVDESELTGFVKVAPNRKQLVNKAGKHVFLAGENITWTSSYPGYDPMAHYFEQLSKHGGNFAKLMLTPWGYHIEWIEGGLRNYMPRQKDVFMLDSLFSMAHEMDLFLQLAFSIHAELNFGFPAEDWSSNPYNIANGGFCQQPQDFFTHPDAKAAYKNRMRYLLARYGYSRQLVAWEVFSETDNFPFYKSYRNQISSWVIEMAGWLQDNDPYDHLVSAGYALPESEPVVWQHSSIDFTQLHFYSNKADQAADVLGMMNMYLKNYQKPVLVGEYGLGHISDSMAVWDPQGLALHNALFSSALAGSMGGVVPWYWEEYVDQLSLYESFGAVHRFAVMENSTVNETESPHLLTDAPVRADWEIVPGFFSLTNPAPSKHFQWHTSGQMIPSADSLNSFLYGPLSLFASLRNPPVFEALFLHEGLIRIETGSQVNHAILQLKQNETVIFEQEVEPNESYWIEVQQGKHQFAFDNIGMGFASVIELEKITLENFLPDLRAFSLQTNDFMQVWIQNRAYNWKHFYEQQSPPEAASGKLFLPLPAGMYRLDWYNTQTGVIDSVRVKEAFRDGMQLQLENLNHDLALQLSLITSIKPRDKYTGVVVYPNPGRQRITFAFELSTAAKVVLQLIDPHGRTVFMTEKSDTYVGTNQLHWDFGGQSPAADIIKPGFYIYRLMLSDRTITGKVMITE
ncbi:MAG: DUF5060 domain-containing protein [Bacteroidales bacterium]|nr:DUF5060 domain-containing protein [Bacteroidales bacterium]